MKKIAIMLAMTLMFFGCAMNNKSKSNLKDANVMKGYLTIYGAYNAQMVGTITWNDNDVCNKTAFLFYAREQKDVDKLVDIAMKETCVDPDLGTSERKCSCKYSGIGLKYRELDVKEAALWGAIPSTGSQSASNRTEMNESLESASLGKFF